MPVYARTLGAESVRFDGLATLTARAAPLRSGDALADVGERPRVLRP